ncbi:hypothetical protein H6P81_014964 [Aristolochia fimbriata]|uniref:Uncharacterized protein n=1 Tax=Aristolochia fimbriata TaxID=158543 RepID=A0AAV7E522_ARIFI|nr:hypothetical protein H6P81_014964 [Aristolochia fimbriata]
MRDASARRFPGIRIFLHGTPKFPSTPAPLFRNSDQQQRCLCGPGLALRLREGAARRLWQSRTHVSRSTSIEFVASC